MTAALQTSVLAGPGHERRSLAGGEWTLCPECAALVYRKRLVRNLHVCPECGTHHRVDAHTRIAQLLDTDSIELLEQKVADTDPLAFADTMTYADRLAAARKATGLDEAVVVARGTIEGNPVILAVMDFRFLGGSLGCVVGELITRAAEIACVQRTPLLLVTASGGARMQEGVFSLMQMAKTSQALKQLDEAGVLTISLVTDPTYGGVAASFATLCDVILAEPRARMGFAGPRVIRQTIRADLPAGFQTAEFLLERGLIDGIRTRAALRPALARLLASGGRKGEEVRGRRPVPEPADTIPAVIRGPERLAARDPWQVVKLARDLERPTTLDYIRLAFDDFEELRGDRIGGDCRAIVGGTARVDGMPVVVIGHQKGHTAAELAAHNYGMPNPAGYRKAARLMRLAGKTGLPVVTLIDTPGAFPGISAEEQGQAIVIAESIGLMSRLPVPIVSVVIGEGGSGGALALGVGDRVLALANAMYSVISPEGCAAILWNDASMAPTAAAALRIGARDLLEFQVVDGVVPEPPEGAQSDLVLAAQNLRAAIVESLVELRALSAAELVAARRARFRRIGAETASLQAHGV